MAMTNLDKTEQTWLARTVANRIVYKRQGLTDES